MPWHKTSDGSIEDHTGKVLFFSKERFVEDICLGRCCFICGAKPESKVFNNEHVIPDWVLRKFDLFGRTISLPNSRTTIYARYKIPCCAECNSRMGHEIEQRISEVVNAGPDAVQNYIKSGGGVEFFVWLGLIFLKTHLKDRDYRINPDRRQADTRIGEVYDWETLHHLHCLVRCFVNGASLTKEVVGSMGAFAAKSLNESDKFDYSDLFHAQTMMIRLDDVALIATFNDACGALLGAMPRLKRIRGPLSQIQAREVMVDFAFMNLSIKERPEFYTECDISLETVTEKAILPPKLELVDKLDYSLRGRLFRYALGETFNQMQVLGKSPRQVEEEIDSGRFTVLFDGNGQFIKNSFVSLPTIIDS